MTFCVHFCPNKTPHVALNENDKPIKITCKICNRYIRFSGKSGELIYINFIHAGMYTIGIYPE